MPHSARRARGWCGSSGRATWQAPRWSEAELTASQAETEGAEAPAPTPARPFDPPAAPAITLEFEFEEALCARLIRLPAVSQHRSGPTRSAASRMVWHDTATGALARDGLALCRTEGKPGTWRLERLAALRARDWLPAHAAPVLAEAAALDALGPALPDGLAPAAAFTGRLRTLPLRLPGGPGRLSILSGTVRGVTQDEPACRLLLCGAAADVATLAQALAETLPLGVPRHNVAARALALSRAGTPAPRQPADALHMPAGATTGAAFGCVVAHLARIILHWAALVPQAGTPEPVHQMRVGVRRLRSALSVFRRACQDEAGACAWLDELAHGLRTLAARLGVARDWDVFLQETGAEVAAAFPQDRRIARLLAAAARRREAAYEDVGRMLGGQDWRRLAVRLAILPTLRPWEACRDKAALDGPARAYAVRALDRRLKAVLAGGRDLSGLGPPQLHDVRKQAKRLRYAAEFFATLFAEKQVRRYLPLMEDLQEVLGVVNDTDVAAGLMAQLAGGADRAFAAGVVQGFAAARSARAGGKVARCWARFLQAGPFWR